MQQFLKSQQYKSYNWLTLYVYLSFCSGFYQNKKRNSTMKIV